MKDETEMVVELLRALLHHQPPKPPARLSPFTERAYAAAEALMLEMPQRAAS